MSNTSLFSYSTVEKCVNGRLIGLPIVGFPPVDIPLEHLNVVCNLNVVRY